MTNIYPAPCVHSPDGRTLCADCQACWEEDPTAYDEYGDHPEGLARWKTLQEEIAADALANPVCETVDDETPFLCF